MIDPAPLTRELALDHMTKALEAAKRARDRGTNVQAARQLLKDARSAFERGDYSRAMERADFLLAQLGADTTPAPSYTESMQSPMLTPGLGDAAGRLAEAKEAVKQAKAHGFNVQAAKAVLKQAKRSYKSRDYGTALRLASQAIELSGSTGRVRP